MSKFKEMYDLDIKGMVETKNGLSYLSWATAWKLLIEHYPEATYTVEKNADNMPYFKDATGGFVYTSITVGGITHSMMLPIFDYKNKTIPTERITAFDINTSAMRCLAKNVALFGIGLRLYTNEDLPTTDEAKPIPKAESPKAEAPLNLADVKKLYESVKDKVPETWRKNAESVLASGTPADLDRVNKYLLGLKG